jgi:GAF domain-containing protein
LSNAEHVRGTAERVRLAHRVAGACALAVVGIGAGTLVGGAFDWSALTRWWAHLPTTVPLTGLVMISIGVGVLLRGRPALAFPVAAVGLVLEALALAARAAGWRHPFETWWIGEHVRDPGRSGLPPVSTLLGLVAGSVGVTLLMARRPRPAQFVAVVGAVIGWLAVLSVLYGDRLSTIERSSFPDTTTSLPAGLAFLFTAAAVCAATPTAGISGWLGADSPGRRAVRRLLPIVLAVPLLIAALARWVRLDERVGEPRAWALVMTLVSAGICVVAVVAVQLIDSLAEEARQSEVTDLRFGAALRSSRIAELSRALAVAITVEEVSEIVSELATGVVLAHASSVGIIDPTGRTLVVHHGPGVSEAVRTRYANPPLDSRLAFTDAARTGEVVLVRDYDEYCRRYPESDPSNRQLGNGGRAALPLVNRSGATFGALALSWDQPVDFDDTLMSTLHTVSDLVAQSLERARLTDEAAQEARRNAELARLAEALATAHSTGDVLSFLADRVTAPLDASTAVIGLVDVERRLFHRHFSSAMRQIARFLATEPLDRPLPLLDAARSGTAVLLSDRQEVSERYPAALDVFDAAGIVATANLPLRDRRGETFGALGVAWQRPVVFDERLRSLLSTIAELAAQTLERAWLADSSESERARAEQLAKLAESLAVAQSSDVVETVVGETVADLVGAMSSRFEPAPGRLGVEGLGPPEDDVDAGDANDDASTVSLPILASDDEPLGTLHLSWPAPVELDESLRSTITTVGELLAQTLERVGLAEAEHRLIEGLQRRTIKAMPDVPGLEVAARYEPAAARLGMGGDWYEGLALDDGRRLGLIVGDVVGHGVDSAVEMTQLSGVLSTLVRVGVPLDALFARVHEVVGSQSIYATALVCVFDPEAQTLELSSAGHLPAVLVDADGARLLEGGRQPMIGVPPSGRRSMSVAFPPGSTLVAFTDGLVERRHEPIDTSLERMRARCERGQDRPSDEFVDELLTACLADSTAQDDVAIVVVRAPARPGGG